MSPQGDVKDAVGVRGIYHEGNAITDALLIQIKQCIENNMISRLEFKCLKDDIGMTIYYGNGLSLTSSHMRENWKR